MRGALARPRYPYLLLLVVALSGCKRGCLASWLGERGANGATEAPPPLAVPLAGVDCPDGLARCVAGTVEVSRLARVADPCVGRPSECVCPWDVVASCPRGCVASDVVLELAPERAGSQLCAPADDVPFARAVTLHDPLATPSLRIAGACHEREHVCVASWVARCVFDADAGDRVPHVLAECVRGCAGDGEGLDETVEDGQAVALLCRRN